MTDTQRKTAPSATSPKTAKPQSPARQPTVAPIQPFRPHRRLFLAIGIMLFAWLAVLLILYFTTIFPNRNRRVDYPGEQQQTTPAPAPAPSSP